MRCGSGSLKWPPVTDRSSFQHRADTALPFTNTSKVGKFVFGVVSAGDAKWLTSDVSDHFGPKDRLECWLDLKKGQEITLRISNSTDARVSLTINQLSIVEIDPATPPPMSEIRK
jgi:hypothetical protein